MKPLTKKDVERLIPTPFPPPGCIKGHNKMMKWRMYPTPNEDNKPQYHRLIRMNPPDDDLYMYIPVEEESYIKYKANSKYTYYE